MPAINRQRSAIVAVTLSALSTLFGAWIALHAQAGPAVEPVTSPAGASSSVPQMTVEGDRVVLSWVEAEGKKSTLKFAERRRPAGRRRRWSSRAIVSW